MSKGKDLLHLIKTLCPDAVAEYRFHPVRRWRADYAVPSLRLLIEIEGGVWTRGRHTRGTGYIKDMEKYNAAIMEGWRLLRYATDQVGELVRDLRICREIWGT